MKRDLKKWLRSDVVLEKLQISKDELGMYEEDEDLVNELFDSTDQFNNASDQLQFIWCEAQKQFLKDILDDIDDSLDKLFRGKDSVKGDKAQLVAYEASVKQWLYNKYHYLKRKNGEWIILKIHESLN